MKNKLFFLKSDYFLTILDNIVATRENMKGIKDEHQQKVKITKIIYFSVIFFFSILSIFSTTILALYLNNNDSSGIKHLVGFMEVFTFFLMIFDYLLWVWSAPVRNVKKHKYPRIFFVFSVLSFNLILSILPSLYSIDLLTPTELNISWITLLKSFKFLRMIRIILLLNLFSSFSSLFSVFKTQKTILTNIFVFIIIVILLFSLIILDAELDYIKNNKIPEEDLGSYVNTFPKAIYFTTITLTTIGYGDITPHSDIARSLVVIMSIIGIAIFAIPSGVIAGAFLSKVQTKIEKKEKHKNTKNTEKQNKNESNNQNSDK
ncbi:potassium channel family protein [Mycoplasma sp. AC157]